MLGNISLVFKELLQLFLSCLWLAGRLWWQTELECDWEATLCSQEDGVDGNPAHPKGSSMQTTCTAQNAFPSPALGAVALHVWLVQMTLEERQLSTRAPQGTAGQPPLFLQAGRARPWSAMLVHCKCLHSACHTNLHFTKTVISLKKLWSQL